MSQAMDTVSETLSPPLFPSTPFLLLERVFWFVGVCFFFFLAYLFVLLRFLRQLVFVSGPLDSPVPRELPYDSLLLLSHFLVLNLPRGFLFPFRLSRVPFCLFQTEQTFFSLVVASPCSGLFGTHGLHLKRPVRDHSPQLLFDKNGYPAPSPPFPGALIRDAEDELPFILALPPPTSLPDTTTVRSMFFRPRFTFFPLPGPVPPHTVGFTRSCSVLVATCLPKYRVPPNPPPSPSSLTDSLRLASCRVVLPLVHDVRSRTIQLSRLSGNLNSKGSSLLPFVRHLCFRGRRSVILVE